MERPITTLFMLMSVDGKISTGNDDRLDFDKNLPMIDGVKEGLQQYYDIEASSDLWSLNTGRVMKKIGVNDFNTKPAASIVSFVIIDNHPHLTSQGVEYLCDWVKQLVLVTTNPQHPAYLVQRENLHIIYQDELDLSTLLHQLKTEFHVERITIQSGGTMNAKFLREKLFDNIDVVVAPVLVGGKDTATLIDGKSLSSPLELPLLSSLTLMQCEVLEDSYLRLTYQVH